MFRWTFNLFIFLLCFQLGFLLFVQSLFYNKRQAQKDQQPLVNFQCGDFDNEKSYYPLSNPGENLLTCLHPDCADSLWINRSPENRAQTEDLHIVAMKRPMPRQASQPELANGFSVTLKVDKSPKPMTLVFLSQAEKSFWNIEVAEGAEIKKIIVVSDTLSWVEGAPEGTDIEYFSREKICALPLAWEEIANPDNQFRRFQQAISTYTGLQMSSFQGKKIARVFSLPPIASKRQPASREPSSAQEEWEQGLQWQRFDKVLRAKEFRFSDQGQRHQVPVSPETKGAVYDAADKKVYLLSGFSFGQWDEKRQSLKKIRVPLSLPEMHWPHAIALDPSRRQIMIYNDERGGEIYLYNLKEKTWRHIKKKVGYTLQGLTYDKKQDAFYGARLRGQKITHWVSIDPSGKIKQETSLEKPYDFSRSNWRLQVRAVAQKLWLKVMYPARPEGEIYSLQTEKLSL